MPSASLTLTIRTVLDEAIDTPVRIDLTPHSGSAGGEHVKKTNIAMGGKTSCRVNGIPALDAGTRYVVEVAARKYRTMSFIQRLVPGNQPADCVLPVHPASVKGIEAPEFEEIETPYLKEVLSYSRIPQFRENGQYLQGKELYDRLSILQRACLLNIAAKASHWSAANVWPFLLSIVRIEQDRLFALVDRDLKAHLEKRADRYEPASSALHTPMPDYNLEASFKSKGARGNLQVTLMKNDSGWAADIDIDEGTGFEHVAEAVRNTFSRGTNPYQVHELLLAGQPDDPAGETKVNPGYRLVSA